MEKREEFDGEDGALPLQSESVPELGELQGLPTETGINPASRKKRWPQAAGAAKEVEGRKVT